MKKSLKIKQFELVDKSIIDILIKMRLKALRDSRMYQQLAVSPEHWHTDRKDAYRESAICLKKQGRALWYAIAAIKRQNRIVGVQECDATEAK